MVITIIYLIIVLFCVKTMKTTIVIVHIPSGVRVEINTFFISLINKKKNYFAIAHDLLSP